MSHGFNDLSDEGKLELAMDYVARKTTLPEPLREFLVQRGMLELIMNPEGASDENT